MMAERLERIKLLCGLEYLKKHYKSDIARYYNKLPKTMQNELINFQYCWQHFPPSDKEDADCIDGLPRQKISCLACIRDRKNI